MTTSIDIARARALLADHAIPLRDVAEQLGFPTYDAFGHWCRAHLGASPRALRTGHEGRGRPPSTEPTADVMISVRCTERERGEITQAAGVLAERWGVTRGAAIARATAEAAGTRANRRSKKK